MKFHLSFVLFSSFIATFVVWQGQVAAADQSVVRLSNLGMYAARCIAASMQCGEWMAVRSSVCKAKIPAYKQSTECFESGCQWCYAWPARFNTFPCTSWRIRNLCPKKVDETEMRPGKTPASTPKPGPEVPPVGGLYPKGCVHMADSTSVVVDLGRVRLVDEWSRVRLFGMNGIVWRKGNDSEGIDSWNQGVMCFPMRAKQAGKYALVAVTLSPSGKGEHNDCYARSSKGFEFWQWGKKYPEDGSSRRWFKAYQNAPDGEVGDNFKHIDGDGHKFLIPNVGAGEKFEVCISGRSSKFHMFKLAVVKCVWSPRQKLNTCTGGPVTGVNDLPISRCVV